MCLLGFHNWWHAGDGKFVCIDCGHTQKGELRCIEPSAHIGSSDLLAWIVVAGMCAWVGYFTINSP
jgi:hypothetical protein